MGRPFLLPMPKPRSGETEKDFISRCMSDSESVSDFPDEEQRTAFCYSQLGDMEANKCKPNGGCCNSCGPVIINAEVSGDYKIFTHEDKEVLSVPVVAIVEGVLNSYFVPEEEFGKFVNSWEGIPVPVDHPQVNGMFVSANIPDILASRNIGRFHNVTADGGKLKGEMWVYLADAEKKGFSEIVERLKRNEKIEVSTAYFADTEKKRGTFNGVDYSGVHRNLRPDHLAILPDDIGACSIENGCGTFQNKQKGTVMSLFTNVLEALGLKANEYKDKEEEIMSLIKNESTEKPEDVEAQAEGMPEDGEDDEVKDMAEKPETNAIDAETLTAVNWAKQEYAKKRDSLVSKLKANERCAFKEDELKAMSVDVLEKLNDSMSGDYSGRGFPITHAASEEEALEVPLVVMEKEVK